MFIIHKFRNDNFLTRTYYILFLIWAYILENIKPGRVGFVPKLCLSVNDTSIYYYVRYKLTLRWLSIWYWSEPKTILLVSQTDLSKHYVINMKLLLFLFENFDWYLRKNLVSYSRILNNSSVVQRFSTPLLNAEDEGSIPGTHQWLFGLFESYVYLSKIVTDVWQ